MTNKVLSPEEVRQALGSVDLIVAGQGHYLQEVEISHEALRERLEAVLTVNIEILGKWQTSTEGERMLVEALEWTTELLATCVHDYGFASKAQLAEAQSILQQAQELLAQRQERSKNGGPND